MDEWVSDFVYSSHQGQDEVKVKIRLSLLLHKVEIGEQIHLGGEIPTNHLQQVSVSSTMAQVFRYTYIKNNLEILTSSLIQTSSGTVQKEEDPKIDQTLKQKQD